MRIIVVVVEQTIYSIYNIIVGRGGRGMRVSSWCYGHFYPFWCSRLNKVMAPQSGPLGNNNAKTWNICQNGIPTTTKISRNHRIAVGEASSATTITQQQRNNKAHKHGQGACCPSGLSYFNLIKIKSSDHRIAWGKAQQQRNNNATTTQQQRNNKTHKHGQKTSCSSVYCQGTESKEMLSDHRIACGEASTTTQQQRDNNTTTKQHQNL